jgi:hypothetical protein
MPAGDALVVAFLPVSGWPWFGADQRGWSHVDLQAIVAAYSLIDENYFPYTRELGPVKRKIFY